LGATFHYRNKTFRDNFALSPQQSSSINIGNPKRFLNTKSWQY